MSSDYRAKHNWQSPKKAAAYKITRDPSRYKRAPKEDAILKGWLGTLNPGASVLDCPCGTGRFTPLITQLGFRYTGADISVAMMNEARKTSGAGSAIDFIEADAEHLPFPDNSFDCVIIWRFLKHIVDPTVRLRILAEAARVSRDKVLISFYHPLSFTFARIQIKNRFSKKKKNPGVFTHWQLEKDAKQCGLEVSETKSFQKYVSINWFACLSKTVKRSAPTETGAKPNPLVHE